MKSVLLLMLAGCAGSGKTADSGVTQPWGGDGGTDSGLCSLATDPDGDGYCADDCAPGDPTIHPGAIEDCNDVDDDCDGAVDNGAGTVWYLDEDGDGWGGDSVVQCTAPATYADNGADCDDDDDTAHPGAVEIADGRDNDCDGSIDEDIGADPDVAVTFTWDRDGLVVRVVNSTAASHELGMAETGAGSGGWYGETCIAGPEPGGVDDYGYDVCHGIAAGGGTIESVYPDLSQVGDGRTLLHQGLRDDLTYVLADPASGDCWVDGENTGYYAALGCSEL